MAACGGKSSRDRELEPDDLDKADNAKALPDNEVSLRRVHSILDDLAKEDKASQACAGEEAESNDDGEALHKKALRRTPQMQSALRTTAQLWSRDTSAWVLDQEEPKTMNWSAPAATKAADARRR